MEYLHKEFDLSEGDILEVNLAGNAANVLLLDTSNFQNYVQKRPFEFYGDYVLTTPYRIEVPYSGHWHLVVDLAGGPGRIQATTRVISGSLSKGR